MGRYGNYPTTVEDCLTFRIKSLTDNNYLSSYGGRTGVTTWTVNGIETSKIGFTVVHTEYDSYIKFDYKVNGEPKSYKVELISKPSNLGKGKVWFFLCPSTDKLCRKLYLHSGYFLHREAFKGLMYSKQLESKKNRALFKLYEAHFLSDEIYREFYSKGFKTHYNGKPTKRYLRLKEKISNAEHYSALDIESLLLSN